MDGSSPYPRGYGAPPLGNGPLPPANEPGYIPQPPPNYGPGAPPQKKRGGLLTGGVALALLLGVVALIVSIIGVTRGHTTPPPSTPQAKQQELFADDADKALCEAIAPLMKESDGKNRALTDSGSPGSPERSAAIPEFKRHTLDWAARMQRVINEHSQPSRYLTRTLQAYVDGSLLYSENIYPDKQPDKFDGAVWDSAAVAYGGPLATCYKLGITW